MDEEKREGKKWEEIEGVSLVCVAGHGEIYKYMPPPKIL